MRAFTVRQPWGTGMVHLGKPVENRGWNIAGAYRGLVAIHTSKPKDDDRDYVREAFETGLFDAVERGLGTLDGIPLIQGAVIGVVDLVDVHQAWTCETEVDLNGEGAVAYDYCSPWAMPHCWHLVLHNPRPLAVPIPWRGALGLWTVPADLEAAIRERTPCAERDGSGR
jgi:hypothetical protein